LQNGYWWEVYPLGTIFILVIVSINYIGDAMRDAFEVRLLER
jgi:peptide/nickel transport system permease protein